MIYELNESIFKETCVNQDEDDDIIWFIETRTSIPKRNAWKISKKMAQVRNYLC